MRVHICISFAYMHLAQLRAAAQLQRPEETLVYMRRHIHLHAICMCAFSPGGWVDKHKECTGLAGQMDRHRVCIGDRWMDSYTERVWE